MNLIPFLTGTFMVSMRVVHARVIPVEPESTMDTMRVMLEETTVRARVQVAAHVEPSCPATAVFIELIEVTIALVPDTALVVRIPHRAFHQVEYPLPQLEIPIPRLVKALPIALKAPKNPLRPLPETLPPEAYF